jgi:hypothetical protein
VKRIAGIFLLSVYLVSFAEIHNFFKLPALFQHFQEHKKEDSSLSFWSYIRIHYADNIQMDHDYQRDNQLPFRDADCGMIAGLTICECLHINVELTPFPEPSKDFSHFVASGFPMPGCFDIFQPPRFA